MDDVDNMQISASFPAPTSTGVDGGVDVDIDVGEVSGEVTLLRDHNGRWSSWGEPAHWASQELLDAAEASGDFAEFLGRIEGEASDVIESEWSELAEKMGE